MPDDPATPGRPYHAMHALQQASHPVHTLEHSACAYLNPPPQEIRATLCTPTWLRPSQSHASAIILVLRRTGSSLICSTTGGSPMGVPVGTPAPSVITPASLTHAPPDASATRAPSSSYSSGSHALLARVRMEARSNLQRAKSHSQARNRLHIRLGIACIRIIACSGAGELRTGYWRMWYQASTLHVLCLYGAQLAQR